MRVLCIATCSLAVHSTHLRTCDGTRGVRSTLGCLRRPAPLAREALARESVEELRAQFVQRFRNVSTIMDCVTCEKCRLWGKLQVLGLGTALKILLMQGDAAGVGSLQRNEVVALVNTLAQLAKSVDSIRDGRKRD